jgi:hypothetical protein
LFPAEIYSFPNALGCGRFGGEAVERVGGVRICGDLDLRPSGGGDMALSLSGSTSW